jgi:hypothetical protein
MSTLAYDKYVIENCNKTDLRVRAKTGVLHYNRFTNSPLGRKMFANMMPQGIQLGAQTGMAITMSEPTPPVPNIAPITGARGASMFSTPTPSSRTSLASSYAFETGSFMSDDGMSVSDAGSLNERERQRERLYELHSRGLIGNEELLNGIARIEGQVVEVLFERPESVVSSVEEPAKDDFDPSVPMGDPMDATPDFGEQPLMGQTPLESSPARGGRREGAGRPTRAEREQTYLTGQTAGQQRQEAGEAVDDLLDSAIADLEMEEGRL